MTYWVFVYWFMACWFVCGINCSACMDQPLTCVWATQVTLQHRGTVPIGARRVVWCGRPFICHFILGRRVWYNTLEIQSTITMSYNTILILYWVLHVCTGATFSSQYCKNIILYLCTYNTFVPGTISRCTIIHTYTMYNVRFL